jgi:hypothetical protein
LKREVPAWHAENGCFSCHNNGDAARALYVARGSGYTIPESALKDTMAWIRRPGEWDNNKGDPGFSDRRLANIQFAGALVTARQTGEPIPVEILAAAARRVIADQDEDGSWPVDRYNAAGSPATYGTVLATFMASRVLKEVPGTEAPLESARQWLSAVRPVNVVSAATLLADGQRTEECLALLRRAQSGDGGWGPYVDSPPEVFDTALALLGLAEARNRPGVAEMIARGREFLAAQQNRDGSWPATTRPSGGESYAQQVSTTGWAVLALLRTRGSSSAKWRRADQAAVELRP